MKRLSPLVLGALFVAALLLPAPARADLDIGFFYERLAPYGEWVQTPAYGWVWTPFGVPVDWRPYTRGRWVPTDEGLLWEADEEWGWIPFHYGRWAYDIDRGWFWVPGTVWAPAWVCWRAGGGFVGWAPLPPAIGFLPSFGFVFNGFGFDDVDDWYWSFVPQTVILAPRIETVVIVRARNRSLMRTARGITRYVTVRGRVVDRSVDHDRLRSWVGRVPLRPRIEELREEPQGRRFERHEDRIRIYRPAIRERAPQAPPRNRDGAERRYAPGGYDEERARLRERHRQERGQLEDFQRKDLEKARRDREGIRYRQQLERNRMEDIRSREFRQLQRRYQRPDPAED